MGFMTGLMTRARKVDLGHPGADKAWSELLFGEPAPKSKISITERSALGLSAVWACGRAISEDIAKLPLKVHRRHPDGSKEVLREHPLYRLLNRKAANYQLAMTFRETLLFHALIWGNGYAEIQRYPDGRPAALHLLTPDRVTPRTDGEELFYEVKNHTRGTVYLGSYDIIHVKGLGFDGLQGYSVVRVARESLGLTAAAEQAGAAFFGSGMRPGGLFSHPGKLGDKARANLKQSMEEQYEGFEKFGKWMLLWEGMEAKQLAIAPTDAQFLETREFQIPEVCRWFRMKPHKIADLSRATYSNIEQQDLEYVGDCLMGWMVRTEQEFWDKLLLEREKDMEVFIEHLVAGLLRGDLESRYRAYAIGRQWGWLSADDVLARENENPLPDGQGDLYLTPSNMTRPDLLLQTPPGQSRRSSMAGAVAGFRPLLEEAYARVLRLEADKARRAHRRGELDRWAAEFYPSHADFVRSALFPVVEAAAAVAAGCSGRSFAGLPDGLKQHLTAMAVRHVGRSREELTGGDAASAAARWEGGRPGLDAVHDITELSAAVLAAYPDQEAA